MLTEEDKARVQKMREMVEATHWLKGSLKKPMDLELEDDGYTCKIDPTTQDYIAGKWGHCLMGLVAEVCDINVREGGLNPGENPIAFENRLAIEDLPEAVRITEALYENLGNYYHEKFDTYGGSYSTQVNEITKKALLVESFNDALSTTEQEVLALIDKTLAA